MRSRRARTSSSTWPGRSSSSRPAAGAPPASAAAAPSAPPPGGSRAGWAAAGGAIAPQAFCAGCGHTARLEQSAVGDRAARDARRVGSRTTPAVPSGELCAVLSDQHMANHSSPLSRSGSFEVWYS
jgi:hypothetical protein